MKNLDLSSKNVTRIDIIPAKILKTSIEIYLKDVAILTKIIGKTMYSKIWNEISRGVLKKDWSWEEETYRAVSIISYLPRVF